MSLEKTGDHIGSPLHNASFLQVFTDTLIPNQDGFIEIYKRVEFPLPSVPYSTLFLFILQEMEL